MLRFPGLEPQSDPLEDPARRSDVDEWGRPERWRQAARKLGSFYYRRWFRVEWEGLENIPTSGGALLIANHAGALPSDAPMIMQGIEEELGGRSTGWRTTSSARCRPSARAGAAAGGVPAHPDNAYRILHDHEQLALVFPEGTKGPSKLASERYRLRRFGRGGFVETAMRAGVPVVPIAVVGAEESMPILFRLPRAAQLLKLPYLPVTANHLLLGPLLGSVVYLPAKFRFPRARAGVLRRDTRAGEIPAGRIMDEAEAIRQQLQEALYDMLSRRRSIWFG